MKFLLGAAILLTAFQSFANDQKLGNVVAIERELTSVFEACQETIKESDATNGNFSCTMRYLKDGEFAMKRGNIFYDSNTKCHVSIDNVNGALLFFFRSKNSTQQTAAVSCLEEALAKKGPIKVILFAIQ